MFLVSNFVRVLHLSCASISHVTPSDQLLMYLVALCLGKLINRCWFVNSLWAGHVSATSLYVYIDPLIMCRVSIFRLPHIVLAWLVIS